MSQLSFFSAEALPPALDDLDGLLAGTGRIVGHEGSAELRVPVADDWRAGPLAEGLGERGLPAELSRSGDEVVLSTGRAPALLPLAERWGAGDGVPPPGLVLDGPRLRWWCLAAGSSDGAGYALRLGEHHEQAWAALGAALSTAGLAAVLVPAGPRGPAYRVVGVKRLRRLAELVGPPPAAAPDGAWPAG